MKVRAVVATAIGLAILLWLVWRAGLSAVLGALDALGFAGFLAIVVFQLVLAVIAGLAWALLGRGRPDGAPIRFVWARLVRDAVSQALPFTQIGGMALGGRALALEGVSGTFATASTLTDMAVEFTTEVAYAALGAGVLQALRPHNPLGRPVLGVIAGLVAMAAGLVWAQARGAPLIERLIRRFTQRDASQGRGGDTVAHAFIEMRRKPLNLVGAWGLHLSAWCLTGVQMWLTLRLMHAHVGLGGALVVDSLTSGARAVAFMVPGALGVQEGAMVLLGQLFGLSPAQALAVSLVRRGRDLVTALPVLAIWQGRHGSAIWLWKRRPA